MERSMQSDHEKQVSNIQFEHLFKQACKLHTELYIHRYLMSNAYGCWNSAEKAECHTALCKFYVCLFKAHDSSDTVRQKYEDEYQAIHKKHKA